MADCLDKPHVMDLRLAQYVRSGREAAAGAINISVCTDKAAVCGLGSGVQGSIFVVGRKNVAILAPPQALGWAKKPSQTGLYPPTPPPLITQNPGPGLPGGDDHVMSFYETVGKST